MNVDMGMMAVAGGVVINALSVLAFLLSNASKVENRFTKLETSQQFILTELREIRHGVISGHSKRDTQ